MTQRAKSARASSAARMRSTPSAGRVYTVIVLFCYCSFSFDLFFVLFPLFGHFPLQWGDAAQTKFYFTSKRWLFIHWTFVRATARGQILDIHFLRRLATRTNEQGLVLYSTYYYTFYWKVQYKTDIQYKWTKMKMWCWKYQDLVALDFICALSFIIQLLNIAGAYRVSNWGSRRKLLRRNACHISNVL